MRFQLPCEGERRQRRFWAFLPVWIRGEGRWWEMVTVIEEYHIAPYPTGAHWFYIRFVDSDDAHQADE